VSLGTFIAGRYSSTYNSVDMGIAQDGYTIQIEPKEQEINRSDAYGETLIDSVYRGANVYCQLESLEYKAGPINAAYPFGSLGVLGVIARLGSDIASAFVLTSTAGTPAAASPATLTSTKAKLAPNSNVSLLFTSLLRTVPIRLVFYPVDASGTIKHFTTT
jgi:hypothetical protein